MFFVKCTATSEWIIKCMNMFFASNNVIINNVDFSTSFMKGLYMNNIYFAIYNPATDSIEIFAGEKLKIIFNCTRLNNNVYLENPLDIAYLHWKNHLIISTLLCNLMVARVCRSNECV